MLTRRNKRLHRPRAPTQSHLANVRTEDLPPFIPRERGFVTMRTAPRYRWAVASAAVVAIAAAGCGAPDSGKKAADPGPSLPTKPASAVNLNILDVAGNLQLTKGMLDNYTKAHPDYVAKIVTS